MNDSSKETYTYNIINTVEKLHRNKKYQNTIPSLQTFANRLAKWPQALPASCKILDYPNPYRSYQKTRRKINVGEEVKKGEKGEKEKQFLF